MQLKSHSCSGERLCAAEVSSSSGERLYAAEALQLFGREAVCSWSPTALCSAEVPQLFRRERLCAAEVPQLFKREAVCSWCLTAFQEKGCVQLKSHSCSGNYAYFVQILMYITSISRAARCTQSHQFSPLHTVTFCFLRTGIRNVAVSKCDRNTTWSVLFFLSWRPELLPSSAGIRPEFWWRPVVLLRSLFAIGLHRLTVPQILTAPER